MEGEDEEGPAHRVNDVLQHLHLFLGIQPANIGAANLHLGEERNPLDVPAPVSIRSTFRRNPRMFATVFVAKKTGNWSLKSSIIPSFISRILTVPK